MDLRGQALIDFVTRFEVQCREQGKRFKLQMAADELGLSYKDLENRLYAARKASQAWQGSKEQPPQQAVPEVEPPQDTGAPEPEPTGWGDPAGERVKVHREPNWIDAESRGRRITTLQGLIDACEIDLSEWTIDHHIINKWEVGAKDDNGNIVVEPLFQVKAFMVRKRPEAIKPVISPIKINFTPCRRIEKRADRLKAALIVPDPQFGFSRDVFSGCLTPFHDRLALDVVRQIATRLEPDLVIFLGDVVDYSGWSDKYVKRPEFYFTTQPALIEASWYIGQLAAVAGKTYVLEGNHDQRPEKQIIAHLVDAYGLRSADQLEAGPVMSVDNLLGLSRMGVKYLAGYPDAEVWINDQTKATHGDKVRGQPGQTAAAVARNANENIIFGHVHRKEMATRSIPIRNGQRTIFAYTPGCLCHTDGRVPGSKKSDNWQQGAAVAWYDENRCTISPIDIENGFAWCDGRIYQGRDYKKQLEKDSGRDF